MVKFRGKCANLCIHRISYFLGDFEIFPAYLLQIFQFFFLMKKQHIFSVYLLIYLNLGIIEKRIFVLKALLNISLDDLSIVFFRWTAFENAS